MKRHLKLLILIILSITLYGCGSTKVTIDYNCEGIKEYKCSVLDDKLNCIIIMPECKGYSFVGWYDAKASGKEVNLDADFKKDTTIYAVWEEDGSPKKIVEPAKDDEPVVIVEKTYKVAFNLNGGGGSTPQSVQVKKDEMMPSINAPIPTRNNYTFMGWYNNKEYTLGTQYYNELNEPVKYYDVKKNITLYAGWKVNKTEASTPAEAVEKTYKVTFNLNGGSGSTPQTREIKNNALMPNIGSSVPTKDGYTFMGWYDNKDYTKGKMYYDETNKSVKYFDAYKDMTLYAGWSKDLVVMSYKLIFNANGGKGGQTDAVMVKKGESLPRITSTAPTKKGHTFVGWFDQLTGGTEYYNASGSSSMTYNKEENTTLYARWKANTYKITFNINGGIGSTPSSVDVTYGNKVPSITKSTPSRNGYTFVGWYDNSDYTQGKAYYSSKNESVLKYDKITDVTLYAGWSKNAANTYVVAFNSNGGTGGQVSSVNVSKGSPMPTISKTMPAKDGFTFAGWYDSLSGGTMYYTKEGNSARNYDKSSGCTLYARWTAINYNIKYTLNGGTLASNSPTSAVYDAVLTINNPYKTFAISINENNSGATLSSTKASATQKFLGWIADVNLDTKNALYGSTTSTNNLWSLRTTKVKDIYFKNLMRKSGTVTLTANWDGAEVTLPTIKKPGYNCGYSLTSTGTLVYASGSKYKPSITTNNAILYAVCTKATYKVSFNANGGSGGQTAQVTVAYQDPMPAISQAKPVRANYTFTGYYDAASGGKQYYTENLTSNVKYDKTSNITLYAGWKGRYTIKYDCNGGTNPPSNQIVEEGNTITLNTNTCKKEGYDFVQWVDPTGAVWKDKWSGKWTYKNGQYGITNDTLTLKAVWGKIITAATYNIGYFGCGTSKKVQCKATVAQITEMFKNANVDIVGTQEAVTDDNVKKLGNNTGLTNKYTSKPANINTILSRFAFVGKGKTTTLTTCHEKRVLDKVVVNINGIDVSFYNTHYSYQSGCPDKQMAHVAKLIKDDPNPVILTGDTNVTSKKYYETHLQPIGFEIAAYDGLAHGYCDSVFVIPKGHMAILGAKTVDVYGKYSDHNFVYATLAIY